MREFNIVLGEDFSAKRAGMVTKWLSEQPRPIRELIFIALTAAITVVDLLLGPINSDILYTLPILLACWMFKPARSFASTIIIIAVIATKNFVLDVSPDPLLLAGSLLVHSLVFLALTAMTVHFREVFDYVQSLAVRDHMTGLLNKTTFNDKVEAMLTLAQIRGKSLLFILIDLDGFKSVNDHYGHAAGDKLLQTFARAALFVFRRGDYFGRVGGDEFAIVLEAEDVPEATALIADAHDRLTHILLSTGYDVTCSMGAVIAPPSHNQDRTGLFELADACLYSVKRKGKDGFEMRVIGAPEN